MTGEGTASLRPRRSAVWSLVFRAGYRLLRILDPLIRSWTANDMPGLSGVVEVRSVGRRTGRVRTTMITILRAQAGWYIGHPNGDAAWIRNAEASGWVEIEPPGAHGPRYRPERLAAGPERDAVIRAAIRQQPFPANLLYRAAQRHIAAVGVYHRLEPIAGPIQDASAPTVDPPTADAFEGAE
ncbi:MAG: hypothetical protein H0V73_06145 [Chloroflexi bacterium]|nr:hypothetical protein [Chloroflexota bacterium]